MGEGRILYLHGFYFQIPRCIYHSIYLLCAVTGGVAHLSHCTHLELAVYRRTILPLSHENEIT